MPKVQDCCNPKSGVCVGDRIISIGGESLDGEDRLRAVELVKRCGEKVRMTIARLDGIIRHERNVSNELLTVAAAARKKSSSSSAGKDSLNAPKATGASRTPPAPRRAANRRQRAVSDFGAIGDGLPTLDGDNLINIKAISGLQIDESDDEKGEYRLPTTSMYAFDRDDDLQQSTKESTKAMKATETTTLRSGEIRKYRYARRSNLEMTEEVEEDAAESSDDDGHIDETKRVIDVELERNQNGSLGVQIASLGGRVCIKQLTSEPALSHPDIRVGDLLLYVNGVAVEGKTHQEVVAMLRGGGDRVVLGVQRPPPAYESNKVTATSNRISVILQKKPMGTLGLSLAKRTMSDGIFIRNIAKDSAAEHEGTLRVGDRLVSLDGEPVDGLTPTVILDKLKAVQGPVQITVTRETGAN
ncbi:unnamed protein product [Caenorhabditis bovis]|uniref:PDZ domain-containing protein n=1 Tax=Caenorhabditis bovis TaxID=2654633 RepID=A0A8S1F6N9_9PELO|nr:unnamed protein product [Caenorhabditis bovis]